MQTDHTMTRWTGHNGAIYDLVYWAERGNWVSAGGDGLVVAWSETGEGIGIFHHHEAFFSVGLWGQDLVAGTASGDAFVLHEGRPRRWKAHENGTFAFATLADGALLTGGGDGAGCLWGRDDSGEMLNLGDAWSRPAGGKIRGFFAGPDGQTLVASSDGTARLLSLSSRTLSAPVARHEGGVYCAVWLEAKAVWLTGGRDGHIRASRPDGTEILSLPAHEGSIYRMCVVGQQLWTAGRDKRIKIWDVDTLKPLHRLEAPSGAHARSVNAMACHRADEFSEIVTGGDDRVVIRHRLPAKVG